MTRVVFVGEMFYSDLQVGGGPMPGGPGGAPPGYWGGSNPHPDQGLPGQPPYPSQGPGFPTNPIAPGGSRRNQPIPSHRVAAAHQGARTQPIYNPAQPDHPIQLPPGGQPIPGLPPPAGHENEVVVAVYQPGAGWTAKAYPVKPSQGPGTPGQLPGQPASGQPQPTPRR